MDGAICLFWSGALLTVISFSLLILTCLKARIKCQTDGAKE